MTGIYCKSLSWSVWLAGALEFFDLLICLPLLYNHQSTYFHVLLYLPTNNGNCLITAIGLSGQYLRVQFGNEFPLIFSLLFLSTHLNNLLR